MSERLTDDELAWAVAEVQGQHVTKIDVYGRLMRIAILELAERRRRPLPSVLRFPYRRARAEALTAHIMSVLRNYIPAADEPNSLERAYRELFDCLYNSGAEITSDADRAAAGLAARNDEGLTAMQLHLLELRLEAAMLAPHPGFVLQPDDT